MTVTSPTPACLASVDLLAKQVLWQARATSRRQAKHGTSVCRHEQRKFVIPPLAPPLEKGGWGNLKLIL